MHEVHESPLSNVQTSCYGFCPVHKYKMGFLLSHDMRTAGRRRRRRRKGIEFGECPMCPECGEKVDSAEEQAGS